MKKRIFVALLKLFLVLPAFYPVFAENNQTGLDDNSFRCTNIPLGKAGK
jgi:hypothetical protein